MRREADLELEAERGRAHRRGEPGDRRRARRRAPGARREPPGAGGAGRVSRGQLAPVELLEGEQARVPIESPTRSTAGGRRSSTSASPGDLAAYEELRAGFTAAVSHELRTPLARVLALLETALLPGADPSRAIEQARAEVEQIGELIDDVLFLSELETGRAVVARLDAGRSGGSRGRSPSSRSRQLRAGVHAREPRATGCRAPAAPADAARGRREPRRERDPLRGRRRDVHVTVADRRRAVLRLGRRRRASPRTTCPASSSASTAATGRARRAARASASRSSSTSSLRPAARSRRRRRPREGARRSAATSPLHQIVTRRSPDQHSGRGGPREQSPRADLGVVLALAGAARGRLSPATGCSCGADANPERAGGDRRFRGRGSRAEWPRPRGRFEHRRSARHSRRRAVPQAAARRQGHGRHLGHRRRLRALLSRRDRPLQRLTADRGRRDARLREEAASSYVELPGRERRARRRREPRQRLGRLPHGRPAEEDLGAAARKIKKWKRRRPELPDEKLELFGPGTDSGTFDYFTDAIVGKEGVEPLRLHGERGRQRHRAAASPATRARSATSGSRTSRRIEGKLKAARDRRR